jgi:spore coat polysaccharide biosynthesis protein SpsF
MTSWRICCRVWRLHCFRGEEFDVLDRYHRAAAEYAADAVVRVTSDCPLIDPALVDEVIRTFLDADGQVDYVSNTLVRSYPRGLDCEVFSAELLRQVCAEAASASDREHVTPFIYRQPDRFRLVNVANSADQSGFRWTVDTPEDFELIRRMLEVLLPSKSGFTFSDCLQVMADHPDWAALNSEVAQKGLTE